MRAPYTQLAEQLPMSSECGELLRGLAILRRQRPYAAVATPLADLTALVSILFSRVEALEAGGVEALAQAQAESFRGVGGCQGGCGADRDAQAPGVGLQDVHAAAPGGSQPDAARVAVAESSLAAAVAAAAVAAAAARPDNVAELAKDVGEPDEKKTAPETPHGAAGAPMSHEEADSLKREMIARTESLTAHQTALLRSQVAAVLAARALEKAERKLASH